MDQTNSLKNEDVKYPPNIPAGQISKASRTPLSSTGYGGNSLSSTIGSTRQSTLNATGGRLLSKSLEEKGKTTVHGRANVTTEEKVTTKSVFYKFSSVIEKSLNERHSTVSVKFERNSENALCILQGTPDDVKNAKITLQDMEKMLYETKVIFSTKTGDALRDLSIEDLVSDLLKGQYSACVAQQLRNEVLLYGFDKEVVENARVFLSKSIVQFDILLCGHLRENKKHVVDHFKNKYHNRIMVYVDNVCRLHMVGQKGAVEEASTECVDITRGRKSLSTEGTFLNLHQDVTKVFGPLEPAQFWFLKRSVKLAQVSNHNKVTVCPQDLDNTITIKGQPDSVSRAAEDLRLIKTSIITEKIEILSPKSIGSFTTHENENDTEFCMNNFDVFLEKKRQTFNCGKPKVINDLHNGCSLWSTFEGKLLAVECYSFENLVADVKFMPSRIDQTKGGRFKAKGNIIRIVVPDMVKGASMPENTKVVDAILKRALEEACADYTVKSAAFLISPVTNWDFGILMNCMVESFVDWLLTSSNKQPYSVLLCTEEREVFFRTDECIGNCLWTRIEDGGLVNKQPKIHVVKGHLDKAIADVIVNTTARNLDLSYGSVSLALLKEAGQELQNECRKYHPNGIKCDEIAVTDGYKLNCKKVFHISLQSQDRSTEGFIQSVRNAMSLCFKAASDYGYKSLAFPAMGTGSLRYPPEEVASEMIMAVERFTREYSKTTSIREVQFVIFPSDATLFQTFQKMEKKLVKKPVPVHSEVIIEYNITGLRQNVKDCKTWLTSKVKTIAKDATPIAKDESTDTASERSGTDRYCSWSTHTKKERSYTCGNIFVRVYEANILDVPVDCIVNAANGDLQHSGGVAKDIAEAAGLSLTQECSLIIKEKGRLPVTSVVRTTAGNLSRYKCVLHAVGPHFADYSPIMKSNLNKCEHDLHETIRTCLTEASDMKLQSIALPMISSGLFHVPKEVCAIQYAKALKEFSSTRSSLREIHFVDKSRDMIDIVRTTFDAMITHGKPAPFDTSKFIEQTGTAGADGSGRWKTFRNTARDRPKSVTKALNMNPDRDFTVNAAYKSNSMKLTCKLEVDTQLEVQVYESDIVNLKDIDAVVCSEDRAGNAKGIVSRLLLKKGGDEYKQEKASRFKCQPIFGEIITTPGGGNSYSWIMHAIIPRKDPNAIPLMYRKIFQEVESKGYTSVAIPLLGTGVGDVDPKHCSEMLFGELIQFCQTKGKNVFTLHIAINEKQTADIVKDVFKRNIDEIKKKPMADRDTEHRDSQHFEGKTAPTDKGTAELHEKAEANSDCVICMDTVTDAKTLECGHMFCAECIEGYFRVKKVCPTCGKVCGTITGDQPDGMMIIGKQLSSVAGFEKYKSIAITYCFNDGTQLSVHPRPGAPYKGIRRSAYLPDNKKGRRICAMLKIAFTRRLVFTIGTSRTTGKECVITWNDIHHKTDMRPNTQFGYPDETYLQRVREELEAKGVTLQDAETELIEELKDDYFKKTFTTDTKL
ncbi:uncharacterized protein LOC128553135 isoform X2 [Mercenaria mercenaria]|uniref:uncharacterized protein LOC128553135 isoform X2 n=1 Tax=Mercenaria mercenaria TaxID=6596 RepID=UPI00234F8B54|nr:uncharacterized protein LOC128553135 isoform X2 [Mercenaria mercenaria]